MPTLPTVQSFAFPTQVIGPVDGSRVVRFVLNTASPDRDGTVFPPRNCDASAFLQNPVFTWGHAELQGSTRKVDPDEVIGRVLAVEVQSNPDRLVIPVEFRNAEANDLAERCFQAVKAGFLRATSITAKPLKMHSEGALSVADKWELWAASLCIVGSNPEALALRSKGRSGMDKAAMIQALGLSESATFEECLQALLAKLTDGDAEKQALAQSVMALKGSQEPVAQSAPDPASTDVEKVAMRAIIDAQKAELAAARAATAPENPEAWAAEQVKAGRWYKSAQAGLAQLRKESPDAAARAVSMFKPGELGTHSERLGALAPRLAGAAARSPNFGPDAERVSGEGADAAEVKADAKSIRDKASRRALADIGTTAKRE